MAYNVSSGQVSSGIILNDDTMYVSSGGTVNNTTVNYYGGLYISSKQAPSEAIVSTPLA